MRSVPTGRSRPGEAQLRDEDRGSPRALRKRDADSMTARGRSTILAIREGMPRDEIQGLFFLLGLLLAFYFLTPFLELPLR